METLPLPVHKYTITDDEKEKRRQAVDFARASIGLEGFTITPEHAAQAERYVSGQIELAELLKPHHASSTAERSERPAGPDA